MRLLLAVFLLGTLLPSFAQAAPKHANALDVVINEVAWAGTTSSSNDEWIELYNPTTNDIDLDQWQIVADDGAPSVTIDAAECSGGACVIPAGGYFLLERTDDTTVFDITADLIYTGSLSNTGEVLRLLDNKGTEIDTANITGSDWDAGTSSPDYASMERIAVVADSATAWASNNGITINGQDADGNALRATPGQPNSVSYQPLSILINEVAWAGTEAYFGDEWIELHNPSAYDISVDGWRLASDSGSVDIFITGTIPSGGYLLLERGADGSATSAAGQSYTSGLLDDAGETLRLLAPDRTEIDTANGNGGAWSHGRLSPASSMERINPTADADNNWVTNDSRHASIKDAGGSYIYGTPGEANWGAGVSYTPTPVASLTPTATTSLAVIINEVAWAGTESSANDEWIELHNTTGSPIDLTGWSLVTADGGLDVDLTGFIDANAYYLLERTDDTTISDIAADLIYSGSLSNDGEYLKLIDPNGTVIDTANKSGGDWDAGSASPGFYSMERRGTVDDGTSAWFSNTGTLRNGVDAEGNDINGTPGQANWAYTVTATPSPIPTSTPIPPTRTPTPFPYQSVVLNEVLPRPGHDWNQDGVVDVNDEFIEIINRGVNAVSLDGWKLDNLSDTYTLPNVSLGAGERIAIYGYTSRLSLSDGGGTVRLLKNNSESADAVTYTIIKTADRSWCRLPENGFWNTACFPTPNEENADAGDFPAQAGDKTRTSCFVPDTAPDEILLIECGLLGMDIYAADFWPAENRPQGWLTGQGKYSVWFR